MSNIKKYYHVTEKWDGGDLESLVSIHGESEAIDIFAERWPEAVDLAYEHSSRIHLHDKIDDARRYAAVDDGEILEITLDGDAREEVFLMIDDLEYPHPVACENIPAEYIRRVN